MKKTMTVAEMEKVLHEMVRDGFGEFAFGVDTDGEEGTFFTLSGKTSVDEKFKSVDFEVTR